MTPLTPGLRLLLRILLSLIAPAICIHSTTRITEWGFAYEVPQRTALFAWIIYLPLRVWIQEEHDIRRLDAVRLPQVAGWLPGNLGIIGQLRRRDDDYMCGFARCLYTLLLSDKFCAVEQQFRHDMGSVLGSGVFNADGSVWKFHRSMTRPFFTRDRIIDFETFARTPVDLQDVLQRFTLDSATEFLLGRCVYSPHSLLPPSHGKRELASVAAEASGPALNRVQERLAFRRQMGSAWPLFEIFGDKTKKDMRLISGFLTPIIQAALDRKKYNEEVMDDVERKYDAPHHVLLDQLLDVSNDRKLIADEVLNILVAGRDTTSTTLTYLIYLLAQHPDVLRRLREEVLTRVGPSRYPDFEDMREMKHLRAVINETMRLFPAVPANVRSNIRATTLPSTVPGGKPYYVPANSEVAYFVMMMQRSHDIWGPDADEFDPSRFLDDRLQKHVLSNPFNFVPFNAGPRICLGQQFAYNEMTSFLVRFLQVFNRMELALDTQPANAKPPARWAGGAGRRSVEKIIPKSALTLFVKLRIKQSDIVH
ncbi:cytochrome P450 [Daedalea quercina L-15889]|uniref:Cytochrome P450 n=1 Tax=Daedalea quercina L-15889 TaxID=1314783 RepID=A0A165NQN5_9APHY|nr:cytochrome P450 [Daedalea quercina L-15889]